MKVFKLNYNLKEANLPLRTIHSISYNSNLNQIAVLRSRNIEIWIVTKERHFQIKSFPVAFQDQCIAWCQDNLISAGLDSLVKQYDLASLTVKKSLVVESGGSRCLVTSKDDSKVAVGTENGFISLLELQDGILAVTKILAKQEGRVFCLAWHPNGEELASGSEDFIRVFNVANGMNRETIRVDRMERNKPVQIWSLLFTSNSTLISGDSEGRTSFWNSDTTTLISKLHNHTQHVQALCITEDEKHVWASGSDPFVLEYSVQPNGTWIQTNQRKSLHTNDVFALAMAGKFLVSGGADTQLVFSKYPPRIVTKFHPFHQGNQSSFAYKSGDLLVRFDGKILIYNLPNKTKGTKLHLKYKIDVSLNRCAAISPDSSYFAYSTIRTTKIWAKNEQHYKQLKATFPPCHGLVFSPDSSKLYLSTLDGKIRSLLSTGSSPTYLATYENPHDDGGFPLLSLNPQGTYLAAADYVGRVIVLSATDLKVHCVLPQNVCKASALAFNIHSKEDVLTVAYSDNLIVEFDLSAQGYTERSSTLDARTSFPPLGIIFDVSQPTRTLVHNQCSIFYFDKSDFIYLDEQPSKKRKSEQREFNIKKGGKITIEEIPFKDEYLLSIVSQAPDHLTLLSLSEERLKSAQPPSLFKKKFNKLPL